MNNLIFEKPSLAPLPHRLGWAFFTALFWLIWIYLWMPLITLAAWALGLQAYLGYFEGNVLFEAQGMGRLAIAYSAVVGVMGGALLLWARIEFLRFHNVNRRSVPQPVKVEEMAEFAKLPAQNVQNWTTARRVMVHHDKNGDVILPDGNHSDA